jgi:hypothetical protein
VRRSEKKGKHTQCEKEGGGVRRKGSTPNVEKEGGGVRRKAVRV